MSRFRTRSGGEGPPISRRRVLRGEAGGPIDTVDVLGNPRRFQESYVDDPISIDEPVLEVGIDASWSVRTATTWPDRMWGARWTAVLVPPVVKFTDEETEAVVKTLVCVPLGTLYPTYTVPLVAAENDFAPGRYRYQVFTRQGEGPDYREAPLNRARVVPSSGGPHQRVEIRGEVYGRVTRGIVRGPGDVDRSQSGSFRVL